MQDFHWQWFNRFKKLLDAVFIVHIPVEFYVTVFAFWLTLSFIGILALFIQYLQVDAIPLQSTHLDYFKSLLIGLWLGIAAERIGWIMLCWHWNFGNFLMSLLIILVPPFRLAARRCHAQPYIWWNDWQLVDNVLYNQLERKFLYPILSLSLLMIPLWIIDLFFSQHVVMTPVFYHVLTLGNALIWGLFVVEFTIMFSIAPKRVDYLKKHWIELLIILLPMLALLRFILVTSYLHALKQANLLQHTNLIPINRLQGMLNIYRSRSVLNRLIRLLVIIDVTKRFYQPRRPERYLAILENQYREKVQELADLQTKIEETRRLIEQRSSSPNDADHS